MTQDELFGLFNEHRVRELSWPGNCYDCGEPVEVTATLANDCRCKIVGGAVYYPKPDKSGGMRQFFVKCDACFSRDTTLRNGPDLEVYSRVVGYLRPVKNWNDAKRNEFNDRKTFDKAVRQPE